MEKLKMIKAVLIDAVADELSKGTDRANTDELSKVIDMLKDIEMCLEMETKNMTRTV